MFIYIFFWLASSCRLFCSCTVRRKLTHILLKTFTSFTNQTGHAVWADGGSNVEVVRTNFLNNNFAGFGVVVVLGGKVIVSMNFGTADDALGCAFVAVSATGDENFTCMNFDLTSQNVSDDCCKKGLKGDQLTNIF